MPHINDKVDFTVEVFIVYKGKVLLRKHDKYKIWLSVGGHIELDEDPNQAAVREVKEEVGLDIKLDDSLRVFKLKTATFEELIPSYFLNRHRINDHHEHVTLTYFARSSSDLIREGMEDELSGEYRWLSADEVKNLPDLSEHIKVYALRALDTLK